MIIIECRSSAAGTLMMIPPPPSPFFLPRCNDQCLGCESFGPNNCRECAIFRILDPNSSTQTCIATCPTASHYADEVEKECRPCHGECRGGCRGPESTDCTECFNFYDALDDEDIGSGAETGIYGRK